MSKQPKRLTRKDKIEIARKQREEERQALKTAVASLDERVTKLETPKTTTKPQGRPGRDFIGKKETNE